MRGSLGAVIGRFPFSSSSNGDQDQNNLEVGDVIRHDRKCRDVPFLVFFIAFWIALIVNSSFGFYKGNPLRLAHGLDYKGNVCGDKNGSPNLRGLGVRYWVNPNQVFESGFKDSHSDLEDFKSICLKDCPVPSEDALKWVCNYPEGDDIRLSMKQWVTRDYDYFSFLTPDMKKSSLQLLGPCYPVLFPSVNVLWSCEFTERKSNASLEQWHLMGGQTVDDGMTLDKTVHKSINSESSVIKRYVADIGKAWPVLIVCGGLVPLVLSVTWLAMIQRLVAAMTWITVALFDILIITVTMLQISEWMNKKGICAFTSTDHAVQLDLIGKVHGFLEAENYFNGLTEQDKTDKTYGALLHCYVRQRQTEKALSQFEKMKEKGFVLSPITYNDIMSLYIRTSEVEKVRDVLNEMKKNGISPDNLSYRTCINSYGDKTDIKGMESVLKEMENDSNIVMDWNTYTVVASWYIAANLLDKANNALKKAEKQLVEKDRLGYNHLISLHVRLGNKDDVVRVWGLQKSACKRLINRDYITVVTSLVKLDEFEEAEKILTEWISSGNVYDFRVPSIIIDGYLKKGLCDKAKDLLDRLSKDQKATTPDSWGLVALEFLKRGDVGSCISCMETLFSLQLEKEEWKIDSKVVEKLLYGVGEKAGVQDVESFVQKLKKFVRLDRGMYHSLMKGYINGGKDVSKVLEDMKADGIEEDEETKKIIVLHQNKV